MTNSINTKRNSSIDIFRLACAILVVAIHTTPLYDVNATAGYIATSIMTKIAVPFFFCVSGFYYTRSLILKKDVLTKNTTRLLTVYILWSAIYFIIDFIRDVVRHKQPIAIFIKNMFIDFFINGSNYQMWFFPALFFCIFMASFFNKINLLKFLAYSSVLLYIIGLLGVSYYKLGNQIPIIKTLIHFSKFDLIRRVVLMGLPFFMLGYFLNTFKDKYTKLSNKKLFIWLGITVIAFLIEILVIKYFKLQKYVLLTLVLYPLVAIIMIILINNPLPEKQKLAHYTRGIANFIFYSHPICMIFISSIARRIGNIELSVTPKFLLTVVITSVFGYILMKIDNKWLKYFIN